MLCCHYSWAQSWWIKMWITKGCKFSSARDFRLSIWNLWLTSWLARVNCNNPFSNWHTFASYMSLIESYCVLSGNSDTYVLMPFHFLCLIFSMYHSPWRREDIP
jgi:hypothetical protein